MISLIQKAWKDFSDELFLDFLYFFKKTYYFYIYYIIYAIIIKSPVWLAGQDTYL
jgi:hypothetical protein